MASPLYKCVLRGTVYGYVFKILNIITYTRSRLYFSNIEKIIVIHGCHPTDQLHFENNVRKFKKKNQPSIGN